MNEVATALIKALVKKMAIDFLDFTELPEDWSRADEASYISLVNATLELAHEPEYVDFGINAHLVFESFLEYLNDPTTQVTFQYKKVTE
jgi:hypothetical protein